MSEETEMSISLAVEQLALALGNAGAVPRGELIRALERAAERLRSPDLESAIPDDLLPQAEAARIVGVSRQAVNQWISKGTLRAYEQNGDNGGGRRTRMVSLSQIHIAANRGRSEPFSPALRRELTEFLDGLRPGPAASIADDIGQTLAEGPSDRRHDDAARVLREFLVAAMGTEGNQQEFTSDGVRMLANLQPDLVVDSESSMGRLLAELRLVVRAADGRAGFDSPCVALLSLLGAATVGTLVPDPGLASVGRQIAEVAAGVWGEDWVRRLFDAAYHVDELLSPLLTRYTAPLVYLSCNRFMRQAQSGGVSITYASSPGAILPQSYHGGPVLQELLAGRRSSGEPWRFGTATDDLPDALTGSAKNPFRIFNFDYGLFDPDIHGVRRYCFSAAAASSELTSFERTLSAADRPRYRELAVRTLASALEKRFVEMSAVEPPAPFDWWKDHIIRSSPRETVIGLRGEKARTIAHGLLVRSAVLPQVVESVTRDLELRERLRVYVKNLGFDIIDERYHDDLRRGDTRLIKSGIEDLTADAAHERAAAEVDRMMSAAGAPSSRT